MSTTVVSHTLTHILTNPVDEHPAAGVVPLLQDGVV